MRLATIDSFGQSATTNFGISSSTSPDGYTLDRRSLRENYQGINYTYNHVVFIGKAALSDTQLLVAKDLWRPDHDPNAYFVGVANLNTGEAYERRVLRSSVDAARHLWLQIANPEDIDNWPMGKHPAYAQPRLEQRRLEIALDPEYRARHVEYRAGLKKPLTFEDEVGLESVRSIVQAIRSNRDEQLPRVDGRPNLLLAA